jgi:hypothetical protein
VNLLKSQEWMELHPMKAQEWLALMMSQWMMIWKMTRIEFDKKWTGSMA